MLKHVVVLAELARFLAFGDHGAEARIREKRRNARAARIERVGIVGADQPAARIDAAAPGLADQHAADHVAQIMQLPEKFHRRVDEHRAMPLAVAARNVPMHSNHEIRTCSM